MNLPASSKTSKSSPTPRQSIPAKLFHWLNLIGVLLMMSSGLQIYNANPVFGGRNGPFAPTLFTLGGGLVGGRHWHFATMWLFALNLLWYGFYIFITRRWQHRFVHSNDLKALQIGRNQRRKIYAWHRIVYTATLPILLLALLSGLGMYKPAQLHWIVDLFGSWQTLRIIHFLTVPTILLLARLHVELGWKAGGMRLIRSMFW